MTANLLKINADGSIARHVTPGFNDPESQPSGGFASRAHGKWHSEQLLEGVLCVDGSG